MQTPETRFFEPLEARPVAEEDFIALVRSQAGAGWSLKRRGVWVHCMPDGARLALQGWKIHLSSVPRDARALLEAVSGFLISRGVPFKFLADAATLRLTGSKSWSRGASGKFVTVYPADEEGFKALLPRLDALTRAFRGPYILSDRRYGDSRVLFYRYGGIRLNTRLRPDGSRAPVLLAPDGGEVPDVRNPFYRVPSWASDPFPAERPKEGDDLLGGRFAVERPLHFSNTGGVYLARDMETGKTAVLKEARPDVHGFSAEEDAVALLRREHAMLVRVAPLGVSPRPLAFFTEWEHCYLAQEHLDGYLTLLRYASRGSLFLERSRDPERLRRLWERDLTVARRLAAAVETLNAAGLVVGDVSYNNVLVHPETLDVKVIDLEGAFLPGEAPRARVVTPGFSDPGRAADAPPTRADDAYGVGAALLFLLTHKNALLKLRPEAGLRALAEAVSEFGLPDGILEAVKALMDPDPARRPRPAAALEPLAAAPLRAPAADTPRIRPEETVREACRFMLAQADPGREDRLFPADPAVFESNPVNLAHGAAGVLYALGTAGGGAPEGLLDWLERRARSGPSLPPGLRTGTAGIAWTLCALGRQEAALSLLESAEGHPLLGACDDLDHGAAGWGLANLKLWSSTGDRRRLDAAVRVADGLLERAHLDADGLFWPEPDGAVSYGLGHGAAGIALFLLYLDCALGGGRFRTAASDALAYDLARGVAQEGTLSWRRGSRARNILYPYRRYGSAGVGTACLRFLRATGEARWKEAVEGIFQDCDRRFAAFPGRESGLAGLGEFHLDAYRMTGEPRFLAAAEKAAAGLSLFAVPQPEGLAFPGDGLTHLSCDLATGSAGVVLFLDRLARPRPADFLLDELLG